MATINSFTAFQSDLDLISSLHTGSDFLTWSERLEYIWWIIYIFFAIALTHIILLTILRFVLYDDDGEECKRISATTTTKSAAATTTTTTQSEMIKSSYQATNLLVNLFLGVYGIYIWITEVPAISSIPASERIIGFNRFIFFAAVQIGYNLWSLPMGLFVVHERGGMIGHHIATLFVASMSCFTKFGFRYHCPFFYGVIEISSVPLSIMNYLSGQKKKWEKEGVKERDDRSWVYDTLYPPVSKTFAVMFLVTRVVLWTPQIYDVLRLTGILSYTCDSILCLISTGIFFISAFFLTVLQYFWGSKVVKGLLRPILLRNTIKKNG